MRMPNPQSRSSAPSRPISHEPIVYPIGVTAELKNADAEAFVKFVQSAKAKALFEEQGFTFLVAPVSN